VSEVNSAGAVTLEIKVTGDPTVYVIAGPNAAGMTTFASRLLPDFT